MWQNLFLTWGCVPELAKGCQDMTNASSTYLGIVAGAIIGGVISWWIYNRQKKTADLQESILNRIKQLDENHDTVLKKLANFEERHEAILNTILDLSKRIDTIIEKGGSSEKSTEPASPAG